MITKAKRKKRIKDLWEEIQLMRPHLRFPVQTSAQRILWKRFETYLVSIEKHRNKLEGV